MIYTIAQLRELARSKDERLADVDLYSDAHIDEYIEKGFEVCEDAKQVFYTKEKYDFTANIEDGLTKVEIILQEEPHNIYAIDYDKYLFSVEITGNKHVIVTFNDAAKTALDKSITVKYFYYPTLPFTEIEMSPEVYHLFRHSLYVNLYGSLRDKENEQYHQAQVDRFVKEGTFTLPEDFEDSILQKDGALWV